MNDTKSPSMSLSNSQRELLQALVDRHADARQPVKRETLAEVIGCHTVTVSTRMRDLRALQLVTSTHGPKGGYEPTPRAYDALAGRQLDRAVPIPITSDGESVEGVRIEEIRFPAVHNPDQCRAELSVAGPTTAFDVKNPIRIGPIPPTDLRIEGIVVENSRADEVVVIEIEAMHAPAEHTASDAEMDIPA